MPVAHRLGLAFVLLLLSFLVLVGFAASALVLAGQDTLAAVVAGTGLAGAVGGGITYYVVRDDEPEARDAGPEEHVEESQPLPVAAAQTQPELRRPIRVQSLPVAKLPPAYVEAVTKGAQARLAALKAQSGLH